MKRISPARIGWFLALVVSMATTPLHGASPTSESLLPEYKTIGDDTAIDGVLPLKVEGVGLVIGLRGTGSEPPPNRYRDLIMEEIKKRFAANPKDAPNAKELLSSQNTSVVLVRAYIGGGVRKDDMLDVEVWVPPGDDTTSLKGGYLLEANLSTTMVTNSHALMHGDEWLKVRGPLLVTENPTNKEDSAMLKKAVVLGQGRVMRDREFRLLLSSDARSAHRTKQMARRINQRFYVTDNSIQHGMAEAKDDKLIILKLAPAYRYDIERYLLVIRRIPLSESETFTTQLLTDLSELLLNPKTAMEAALRLEALGKRSLHALRQGLASESELVRFCSAQTMAYLGDSGGAEELARFAQNSEVYRPYALGALVSLQHPASRMQLNKLLHAEGAETRYGAFRSLWAFDHKDRLVVGEVYHDQFDLHCIRSQAVPMVHVARNFRRELVIFNDKQQLLTPLSLHAGSDILLNADASSDRIFIASFRPGESGTQQTRGETGTNLAEVIRELARQGASYGDVVDFLQEASMKGNLMGRLVFNALPKAMSLDTINAIAKDEEGVLQNNTAAAGPTLPSLFSTTMRPTRQTITESDELDDKTTEKRVVKKKSFWNIFSRSAN